MATMKKNTYPQDDSFFSVVELSVLCITIALCVILPSLFMLPVLGLMGIVLIAVAIEHDHHS